MLNFSFKRDFLFQWRTAQPTLTFEQNITRFFYSHLQEALQELVFLPFTGFLLLFFILLCVYLPETKGKSFEEVAAIFAKRSGIEYTSSAVQDNGGYGGGGAGSDAGYRHYSTPETAQTQYKSTAYNEATNM